MCVVQCPLFLTAGSIDRYGNEHLLCRKQLLPSTLFSRFSATTKPNGIVSPSVNYSVISASLFFSRQSLMKSSHVYLFSLDFLYEHTEHKRAVIRKTVACGLATANPQCSLKPIQTCVAPCVAVVQKPIHTSYVATDWLQPLPLSAAKAISQSTIYSSQSRLVLRPAWLWIGS